MEQALSSIIIGKTLIFKMKIITKRDKDEKRKYIEESIFSLNIYKISNLLLILFHVLHHLHIISNVIILIISIAP